MSIMHILGGIFIGALVGRIFSAFTLRKVKGGKYTFMLVGIAGAFIADFTFMYLNNRLVSSFFYQRSTIIFEMIGGAIVACYLVNLLGKKESIYF